ncbi:MAG: right-handed parallel beta-helix repeat-containing protein, partial [Candidatus Hodarchaeota archaeon]
MANESITGTLYTSANHPKISITGDSALLAFPNKTGGGGSSWADAIIIEDLVIDANNSGSCIYLKDTTYYVVIQNCTVINSGSGAAGIYLYNAINVNITGNHVENNYYGIYLRSYSDTNFVLGNNVTNCRYGIDLFLDSDSNYISGNE